MTSSDLISKIISEPSTGATGDTRSVAIEAVRQLLAGTTSANTRRAYEGDLAHFFASQGEGVTTGAVELLLASDAPRLLVTLRAYVTSMRRDNLSEATIKRRVTVVRSLIRTARLLGASTPDPKQFLAAIKVEKYRNIDGPEVEEVAALLDAVDRTTLKGKRDYAVLLLLTTNALRREEIIAANVSDFDRKRKRLSIIGKGQSGQKVTITLLSEATDALTEYLGARGTEPADPDEPLIASCDRRLSGRVHRLTGRGLWEVVDDYGVEVLGRRLHPHAFRHGAITEASNLTGGNLPMMQEFSRHKDVNILTGYIKKARDNQGEITRMLGERLREVRSRRGVK